MKKLNEISGGDFFPPCENPEQPIGEYKLIFRVLIVIWMVVWHGLWLIGWPTILLIFMVMFGIQWVFLKLFPNFSVYK